MENKVSLNVHQQFVFFLKNMQIIFIKVFYKLIDNIIIKSSKFILKIIFLIIKKLLTPIRNKIKKLIFIVRSEKSTCKYFTLVIFPILFAFSHLS
jgi:hypothetical protein